MPPPGTHPARAGGRRRRRPGADHGGEGGAERWLVTYADMLTLLLVLFIVLFSISVVNTSKFLALRTSLAAVFGNGTQGQLSGGIGLLDNGNDTSSTQLTDPAGPIATANQAQQSAAPTAAPTVPSPQLAAGYTAGDVTREVQSFKSIEQAIDSSLAKHGLRNAVRFAITGRGLVITVITTGLIFPGNSAELLAEGQQIIAAVAPPLAQETRQIEVDGYTNQVKVSTYPYPSGWELSSARASTVVRYLIHYGVAESRLRAVGFSDQHPLYPPSDPRSVQLNRRVEIVALSTLPSTASRDLQAAGGQP